MALKIVCVLSLFVASGCSVQVCKSLACRASLQVQLSPLADTKLVNDRRLESLDIAILHLNGAVVQTVGFEPYLLRVAAEADSFEGALAVLGVQSRAHARLYALQCDGRVYLYFEVSDIPGAADRPMSNAEILSKFAWNRELFTLVNPHCVYVEPQLASDAVAMNITLPEHYVPIVARLTKQSD